MAQNSRSKGIESLEKDIDMLLAVYFNNEGC